MLGRQAARAVSVTGVPRVGEPAVFPGFRAGRLRLWLKISGIIVQEGRFSGSSLCSAILNIRVGTRETGSTASRDRFVKPQSYRRILVTQGIRRQRLELAI